MANFYIGLLIAASAAMGWVLVSRATNNTNGADARTLINSANQTAAATPIIPAQEPRILDSAQSIESADQDNESQTSENADESRAVETESAENSSTPANSSADATIVANTATSDPTSTYSYPYYYYPYYSYPTSTYSSSASAPQSSDASQASQSSQTQPTTTIQHFSVQRTGADDEDDKMVQTGARSESREANRDRESGDDD